MPKAVLKNGQIIPVDPLPLEWKEGQEFVLEAVEKSEGDSDDTAAWIRDVEEAAAAIPPESEHAFLEAIKSIRAEAKLRVQ